MSGNVGEPLGILGYIWLLMLQLAKSYRSKTVIECLPRVIITRALHLPMDLNATIELALEREPHILNSLPRTPQ